MAFILMIISGCSVIKNHIIKERRKSFVHLLAVSEIAPGFKTSCFNGEWVCCPRWR